VIITQAQLIQAMPYASDRAAIYLTPLNDAMTEFGIDTLLRQACFLAQIAHESGSLRYTIEGADGMGYDITVNPKLAAELGNTEPGDGKRYRGRGLLQVTGRANSTKCLEAMGRPVDDLPYLETPVGASRSAGWFWQLRGLNEIAELGNFGSLTTNITGGYNGIDERIKHYIRCRKALGI
jgi:putative chitinase